MANSKRLCPNHKSPICRKYNRPEDGIEKNGRLYCNNDNKCVAQHQLTQSQQLRGKRIKEKHVRKQKRALKADSLGHQKELTQQAFNRFIRALDKGKPCHSCGQDTCGYRMEAGHVLSVGACPSLRYDPRNCFSQGSACNGGQKPKRGKNTETVTQEYKRRLALVLGQEWLDWLESYHPPKHYTREELKAMRKEFAEETRRLEAGLPPSRDWRELPKESGHNTACQDDTGG
jgi:hypothetical protein